MSDKEIKKAHIEEIELELPSEEVYITPEEPKIKRERPKSSTRNNINNPFFQEAISVIRETMKAGVDVVKSYKEEILSKKEEETSEIKPNSAFIDNSKEKNEQSTVEIEFAEEQEIVPKTPYKMSASAQAKKQEVKEEPLVNQASKQKKRRISANKNRPSASPSARAGSFVEIFQDDEDQKSLISDKDFRRFIGIATTLLVLFGLVWYGFTYINTDDMSKVNTVSASNYPGPIKPSDLFSSRTPEVVELLGDPKASGSIDATENSFMEYEQSWFGEEALSKIVYGIDKRVYFVDLAYKNASMEKIYQEMVKYLGEPITNNVETKEATWFIDSCMYILTEENQAAMLNIQTPLYDNVNSYPIAEGAMIIQKQSSHDLTGDGKNDVVVIIGEKENYIYKEFTKLHMTIWDGENVYYTAFPGDTDGGANPKITYEDVDKDGITDVSIETKNNAINNYNSFTVKNAAISSIYASHEKSK